MKNFKFILIIPLLLATTCATKQVGLQIVNTTNSKYFITNTKNMSEIKIHMKSNSMDEVRVMKIDEIIFNPLFLEPFLTYYRVNGKKDCLFYLIKQDDFMNEDYKFDSLVIPEKDIKFEDKGLTQIIIDSNRTYYKSW